MPGPRPRKDAAQAAAGHDDRMIIEDRVRFWDGVLAALQANRA